MRFLLLSQLDFDRQMARDTILKHSFFWRLSTLANLAFTKAMVTSPARITTRAALTRTVGIPSGSRGSNIRFLLVRGVRNLEADREDIT